MRLSRSDRIQQALFELDIPAPRKVRLRTPGEAKALWLRVVLVLTFLSVIGYGFFYFTGAPTLASRFGNATQANIQDLWLGYESNSKWSSDTHVVSYSIKVDFEDGPQRREGTAGISKELYNRFFKGQNIGIHYLPYFPIRPSLDNDPPGNSFFVVIGIFLIIVFVVFLDMRNKKHLLVLGTLARGQVYDRGSKGSIALVSFDHQGKTYKNSVSVSFYGGMSDIGDQVIFLFEPENPSNHMVYDSFHSYWVPVRED